MEVEFHDKKLALIDTDRAKETGFPEPIIKACQRKLNFLKSAPDELTLRNWKSLHYEKLSGDREGQRSIRLNDKMRLVFILNTETSPPKISVLSIEDYH